MKCPQCGNEAINVNGKYVCLDCGVQIENEPPKVATPTINHTFEPEPVSTEATPAPILTSVNTPINSAAHPVQDMIMANLDKEEQNTVGTYNFETPLAATATNPPVIEPIPVTQMTPIASEEVMEPFQEAVAADEPLNSSPVVLAPEAPVESQKTTIAEPLAQGGENTATTPEVNEAETSEPVAEIEPSTDAPVDNNFTEFKFAEPETTTGLETAPAVEASENQQVVEESLQETVQEGAASSVTLTEPQSTQSAQAQEAVALTEAKTFSPDDLAATFDLPPAPVETQAASGQKEFFQPSSINIQSPSEAGSGEPKVGDLEGVPSEEENVVAPISPEPQSTESPVSLDDLLEKYDQSEAPVPVNVEPSSFSGIDTVTAVSPILQSAAVKNEIPSVESVFGGTANASVPRTVPAQTKGENKGKSSKKLLYIIIGSIIGILILAVIVFSFVFTKSNPKKSTNLSDQDTLRISNLVSSAMDAPQNISAEVSQKIDFSKVSVRTADKKPEDIKKLEDFFKIPVELSVKWQADKEDNLSYATKKGGVQEDKVYIAETNKTYSKVASNWQDSAGAQILFTNVLFNHQNRGSIFYLTKIESLQDLGGEDLDGTTYSKFKITPKAEVVKDFLNSQSSLLESLAYESMDSQKLEILAWVDSDGLVQKVTVNGDVFVRSGTYEGTINISTTANYDYDEVSITSPLAFLSKSIF